ncbi:MAG TPA: acetate--CoA ligase family protein, partial [Acidimicrobiales bacterium]|nr:acetate--CoA ligase family protein [Acidimicrobiales bacterium]
MATLSEADSKQLLRGHGVPVVPEELASDPAAAADAAERVGFPVVAKLCAPGLAHKTERGLVRLGLCDRASVEVAARDLLAAAGPGDGDVGVLVGP